MWHWVWWAPRLAIAAVVRVLVPLVLVPLVLVPLVLVPLVLVPLVLVPLVLVLVLLVGQASEVLSGAERRGREEEEEE